MHRKIAKKYMSRVLSDHLQQAVSGASLSIDQLDSLTERALGLIEDSTHRDHIYKQAGDMIFLYQTALEDLRDQVNTLSYLIDKISLTAAADDMKPALKQELEKALSEMPYE